MGSAGRANRTTERGMQRGEQGSDNPPIGAWVALTVLLPFALGYFLSYLFRAVNAVVAPDLVKEVGLSASELGLLTAAYLLAFAACQLPVGILLDRYGPRRVQAGLLVIAAGGAALFAVAQSALVLTIARALIGLGVAGSLMSGFKAVVLWVAKPRQALANSWVMSVGAIGLLVSTAPTEWAVQQVGWRSVFLGSR
jgi:MFS family permease